MATSFLTVARFDIWEVHKFVKTEAEASVLAVRAGTDLTCGGEYATLLDAVKQRLVTEAEIDTMLKRPDDRAVSARHV